MRGSDAWQFHLRCYSHSVRPVGQSPRRCTPGRPCGAHRQERDGPASRRRPGPPGRRHPRRCQRRRRRQPQRCPHGRAPRRLPHLRHRCDGEPPLRFQPGSGDPGQPSHRSRRRRAGPGRRRGIDEPGAVGAAQAVQTVSRRPRDPALLDPGLADGEPAHAETVDGLARRNRRNPCRALRHHPRTAGCVCAGQSPEGRRCLERRHLR